jgi:hypothetical protein
MTRPRRAAAIASAVVMLVAMLAGCSSSTTSTDQAVGAASASANAPATQPPEPPASTPAEVNPAGDIPDDQAFVAWSPADTSFTVKVPEGWAQSTDAAGATVFTDKLNSIAITTSADKATPTIASVTKDLAAIRSASPGWQDGTVSAITRTAGPAVLATYRADAAADPVTGKVRNDDVERYVFHRSGETVVLTLAGPHGADNVDPWRIVTDSFTWAP